MAKHTITHAKDLYRGKDRSPSNLNMAIAGSVSGVSAGVGNLIEGGQRGVPMYIAVKQQWSSTPAANSSGLAAEVAASATIIGATVTMTGDATGRPLARVAIVCASAAWTGSHPLTVIGEDIHGVTVTNILSVSAAGPYRTPTAYRVIYSAIAGSLNGAGVDIGHTDDLGLAYKLQDRSDVIAHTVMQDDNTASGTMFNVSAFFQPATASSDSGTAITTAPSTVGRADSRGTFTPSVITDGDNCYTVWYYVADTDHAYGGLKNRNA